MKRVVKKPEIRRQEIMDAAKKLFDKEGYAKTSVDSIIQKAGIAKGTFFYYFKTKRDILEALVLQTISEMEEYLNSIIEKQDLNAIQKLKLIFRGPEKKKITSSKVMEIIHHPENRELQENLNIQTILKIAPLILRVFEEGKKERVFSRSPTLENIQLFLAASLFILDSGLFDWPSKTRVKFLKHLEEMMEGMAGVKPGTLSFISKEK